MVLGDVRAHPCRLAGGTQLRRFSPEIMDAARRAAKAYERRHIVGFVVLEFGYDRATRELNLWQGLAFEPSAAGSWSICQEALVRMSPAVWPSC